jgi:hypothetical protein
MWWCVVRTSHKGEAGRRIVAGSEESSNMDQQNPVYKNYCRMMEFLYIIIAECSKMRQV